MKDFKDLKVWHKAHELTLSIYKVTEGFPKREIYGITSQLKRSSASVGANIVEGCGRRSDREFRRFLQIARGSASETEYHLILARDLGFLAPTDYGQLMAKLVEVQRMLTGLVQTLESAQQTQLGARS